MMKILKALASIYFGFHAVVCSFTSLICAWHDGCSFFMSILYGTYGAGLGLAIAVCKLFSYGMSAADWLLC